MVCLTTNGQGFCESYRRSGLRVVIIEEYYENFAFMVIDKHFWKVKYDYENQTLVFDPLDKKAANPRQQFVGPHECGNYSFALISFVFNPHFRKSYLFHKVLKIKFSSKTNNFSVNNSTEATDRVFSTPSSSMALILSIMTMKSSKGRT